MISAFLTETDGNRDRRKKLRDKWNTRHLLPARRTKKFQSPRARRQFEAQRTPLRPFSIDIAAAMGQPTDLKNKKVTSIFLDDRDLTRFADTGKCNAPDKPPAEPEQQQK